MDNVAYQANEPLSTANRIEIHGQLLRGEDFSENDRVSSTVSSKIDLTSSHSESTAFGGSSIKQGGWDESTANTELRYNLPVDLGLKWNAEFEAEFGTLAKRKAFTGLDDSEKQRFENLTQLRRVSLSPRSKESMLREYRRQKALNRLIAALQEFHDA
jgi:hypothetical protein